MRANGDHQVFSVVGGVFFWGEKQEEYMWKEEGGEKKTLIDEISCTSSHAFLDVEMKSLCLACFAYYFNLLFDYHDWVYHVSNLFCTFKICTYNTYNNNNCYYY